MRTPRTILTLLLPFLSYGCVASPAFMATSSAGDNAAYSETGKSMLDYALSKMLDRDCTVMHGFTRGRFCRDVPKSPVVEATASKADGPADGTVNGKVGEAGGVSVLALTEATSAPVDAAPAEPTPGPSSTSAAPSEGPAPTAATPPGDDGRWAFVLGIFKEYEEAAELASKLKPGPAIVSSIVVRGEVFYRVTTSPFKLNQAAANEKHVAAMGIPDARMVAVCPGWMRDDACLVLDRRFPL